MSRSVALGSKLQKYYAKLGWAAFPSLYVSINISKEFNREAIKPAASTKRLKLEDIQSLCEQDTAQIKTYIRSIQDKEKTHIALAPTFAQVSWHMRRAEIMADVLLKKNPQIRGAITENRASWLYWDHDLRANELVIIRIVLIDHTNIEATRIDLRALLEAAIREATEWNIPKVCIWNPDSLCRETVDEICREGSLFNAVYEGRDNHIPSLRWREDKSVEDVVWDFNEYYGWC